LLEREVRYTKLDNNTTLH